MNLRDYVSAIALDNCGEKGCSKKEKDESAVLDSAADFAEKSIAAQAVASVQAWAETDDLDEGEGLSDRFVALMVGIADENHDGEITEDEEGVIDVALQAAADYLESKGASEEDVNAMFDGDEKAAKRLQELLADELPDGEEADEDIDNFVFSDEENAPALDAVYRKRFAIRHGKKVRINKRVSGTVRLTAKQKVALRKARVKSHSAQAMMRRMKSARMGRRMGLGKK